MHSTHRRDLLRLGTVALTTWACSDRFGFAEGAAPVESKELADLVASAKKEGSVTLYNAVPTTSGDVAKAFEKLYSISATVLELPSGTLLQRFSSEAEANAPTADVIIAASLERTAPGLIAKGWLDPIRDSNIPVLASGEFPARFVGAVTATLCFMPFVLAYNTDEMKKDQPPKAISDLGDPKYKGKILLIDPATSETHIQMWDKVRHATSDKVLQAIAANDPRYYASATAVAEALAAGEGVVAVTTHPGLSKVLAAGAPIAYVTPAVTTGSEMQIALVGKPSHPAAGRLMANFLLSADGNKILSNGIIGTVDSQMSAEQLENIKPDDAAIADKDKIFDLLGKQK